MRLSAAFAVFTALLIAALPMAQAETLSSTTMTGAVAPLPAAKLSMHDFESGTILRLDGIITPEIVRQFDQMIAAVPAGRPLIIELSSPGGYTTAGYSMIDRIMQEREAGRPVASAVRGGESCESMCVGLFMAGYPRYAAPDAQFMVHAPRGLNSGVITVKSTGRMIDRLIALGASAAWIEQVKSAGGFSGRVDYRITAAELAQNGANVVTTLVP